MKTVSNNTVTEEWIDITLATISNCDLLYFIESCCCLCLVSHPINYTEQSQNYLKKAKQKRW